MLPDYELPDVRPEACGHVNNAGQYIPGCFTCWDERWIKRDRSPWTPGALRPLSYHACIGTVEPCPRCV